MPKICAKTCARESVLTRKFLALKKVLSTEKDSTNLLGLLHLTLTTLSSWYSAALLQTQKEEKVFLFRRVFECSLLALNECN